MNLLKYIVAKIWFGHMCKTIDIDAVDERIQQRWVHLQGQILTKGRIKWNWKKLLGGKDGDNNKQH